MKKIPWKPEYSLKNRPLQGLSDSIYHKKEYTKESIPQKNLPQKESEEYSVKHKLKEQKLYFIAIIVVIIILFILILRIVANPKPTCPKGDIECENYYNENPMQWGTYH